jgi:hypothetical protein
LAVAKAGDELAFQSVDRLLRFYAKNLLTADELGGKVLDNLVDHRATAGAVRESVRRLPAEARPSLEQRARELADPAYQYVLWGLGPGPTPEQREWKLAEQRRVAGLVVEALAATPPASDPL